MRIIANENISASAIQILRVAGYDVTAVKETMRGASMVAIALWKGALIPPGTGRISRKNGPALCVRGVRTLARFIAQKFDPCFSQIR
jgi:hypothetical protein